MCFITQVCGSGGIGSCLELDAGFRFQNSITCIFDAGVAELVDALDLGSSNLGCESSSLSFRTMFLIRTKTIK